MDILNTQSVVTTEKIDMTQSDEEVTQEEVIEVFVLDETDEMPAETFEAFPALGASNEGLRHSLLHCRDIPDQHPILAITGLRDELNEIEALKTVYSDKINHANYYLWNDANASGQNRVGLFVAACRDTDCIKIASEDDDIFGVTVDCAGFIGGQDDMERDASYGLVAHSGLVYVRCELPVSEGDSIASNSYGYGTKVDGDYGCKVIDVQNSDGIVYAIISLGTNDSKVYNLGNDISSLSKRVDTVEKNVIATRNTANEAYRLAKNIDFEALSGKITDEVDQIKDITNSMSDAMNNVQSCTQDALKIAQQASALATNASNAAIELRNKAVETSNDTLSKVNDLIRDVEPLTTWKDAATGNSGAEYLINYINNGLSTRAEVAKAETDSQDAISISQKNAKEMQSLVATIDKYSVGDYSQANGLTKEQAKNILEQGMIYAPVSNHKESSYCDDTYSFTKGYCYTWDGTKWLESSSNVVTFSASYVAGSDVFPYWYTDINNDIVVDDVTYEKYTLYLWKYDRWNAVATLMGNVSNRAISQIRQTANDVSIAVTNANGSISGLRADLNATNANLQTLVTWTKDNDGKQYSLATIKQTADDAGASIAQVVKSVGKDGKVTAASIVAAVNGDESGVTISADHINLVGAVTANTLAADVLALTKSLTVLDSSGNTLLNADGPNNTVQIAGWNIDKKSIYKHSGSYGSGMFICTGTDSSFSIGGSASQSGWMIGAGGKFGVTKDGNMYCSSATISGSITATSGNIGGCLIQAGKMVVPASNMNANGISATNVDLTGKITATSGTIGGWKIFDNILGTATTSTSHTDSHYYGIALDAQSTSLANPNTSVFAIGKMTGVNGVVASNEEAAISGWWNQAAFRVTANGHLYASDAEINGKVTATSGKIGGWTLNSSVTFYMTEFAQYYTGAALSSTWVANQDQTLSYTVHLTPVGVCTIESNDATQETTQLFKSWWSMMN